MTPFHYIGLSSILLLTLPAAHAAGNTTQDSFNKACSGIVNLAT